MGGGSLYKGLSGDVPLKWVSKSASWYETLFSMFSAKTGISMGHIFEKILIWHEITPNFINLIPKFA